MATNTIKMTAVNKDSETTVKAIIEHPMSSGLQKNKKTGDILPAHFIKEVTCKYNDEIIFTANWSAAISINPYLSFKFSGGKRNEKLTMSWLDNLGDTDSQSEIIK